MRDCNHSKDVSKKGFLYNISAFGALLLVSVIGLDARADDTAIVIDQNSDEVARHSNDGDVTFIENTIPYLAGKGAQNAVEDADRAVVSGQRDDIVEALPATQISLSVSMSMSDLKETYTIEDDGYYHVSATYSIIRTETRQNGMLQPVEEEVDTELPDRQKGEYERLKLIQADGSTYLRMEIRGMVEDEALSLSVDADVEFVEGNWEQYEAGKTVKLRYTSKGLKEIASQLEKLAQQQFTSIFTEQVGKAVQVRIDIINNPNEMVVIDPKQIEITANGVFKMKMSMNYVEVKGMPNWDEFQEETIKLVRDGNAWEQLNCDELNSLLSRGLLVYGITYDGSLAPSLIPIYQKSKESCSIEARRNMYIELRNRLMDMPPAPYAFMPFLLIETDRLIVATATIDYAMMADTPAGGLQAVEELLGFLQQGSVQNRGAMFGGLIFLGDPRVIALLTDYRSKMKASEINEAANSRTEFPTVDSFFFWLQWAEELASSGDTESGIFGSIMSAMAMILRDDSIGTYNRIHRRFGYIHLDEPPGSGMEVLEAFSKKEFGGLILDRLYELEIVEAPPKLSSDIILRFGFEPRAPLQQQYRDAYRLQ